MAMGPMPDGQAQETDSGGASQLVADTHSNLLKLQELLGSKFPEDAQALGAITQAFQSFVDGLGQAPGQGKPEAMPGTTTPEAGASNAQPAM